MNGRTMKRSMKKAQGLPNRVGPEKGTTGKTKGPAYTPSAEDVRQQKRRLRKIEAAFKAAAQNAEETKAA